jgi:NAD(P)-dependent dehydrogenase (short-subunit alcohol dehydrogenase family)
LASDLTEAEAGMKVMLADIQEKALDEALHELKGGRTGREVRGVHCDVADLASLKRAADETFAAFGNVHVICNNAGVGWGGQVESLRLILIQDRPQKVTVAEMRSSGVRGLLVYCFDYRCSHSAEMIADQWPDDARLSAIKPCLTFLLGRTKG